MGSFGSGLGLGFAIWVQAGIGFAACAPDGLDLRGPGGQQHFTVEVADEAAERSQGLMFREKMATSAGVLFVYEQPVHPKVWMKKTLIPLDMIFLGAAWR